MKKNILIIIIIALIVYGISVLNEIYIKKTGKTTISMIIKKGSLTNTSATIIITDNNPSHTYGDWFRIDEKVNGKWEEVSRLTDNDSWILIGYNTDKNSRIELDEDWSNIYGKLEPGEYRIVKNYIDKSGNKKNYIYEEFAIE